MFSRLTKTYKEDKLLRDQIVDGDTVALVGREGLAIQHGDTLLDTRMYSVREFPPQWAGWGMDKLIGIHARFLYQGRSHSTTPRLDD